ncbi:hypothetical protein MBLNU230_g0016t1 [Neophaeotheca triangularis]
MPPHLQPLAGKKFVCTYDECPKAFDTLKEMKQHKFNHPDHNYCKKCNMDFISWDELTQHKVDMMAPFLEGNFEESFKKDSPVHIVCEFCGEEFKTFGGREIHRTRTHPADQRITCKGCNHVFVRASLLIGHFESGDCSGVSRQEFEGEKQKKHVHKQMMNAPDRFVANIESNMQSQLQIKDDIASIEPSLSGLDSTTDQDLGGSTAGGVLLDMHDPNQYDGQDPMAAEMDLMSFKEQYYKEHPDQAPLTRGNLEQRPGVLWEPTPAEAMAERTLGSRTPSVAPSEYSNITSRRGGLKVYTHSDPSAHNATYRLTTHDASSKYGTENYPSLTSPLPGESALSNADNTSDTASQATTTQDTPAWTTGNTSKTLFKPSPLNTLNRNLGAHERGETTAQSQNPSTNLFRVRFWDPTSPDYDANRFYHAAIRAYCCPFPSCPMAQFPNAEEMELHLTIRHATQQYRCPACLKVFKTSVALVSHCENAAANCRIQETGLYRKLIDEISGGYLQAHRVQEVPIYRPEEESLIPVGEPTGGVAKTLYEGTVPRRH